MTNIYEHFMAGRILENSIKIRYPVSGRHDNDFGYRYHLYEVHHPQKSVWVRFNSDYVDYSKGTKVEDMVPETYYQFGDIECQDYKSYFIPKICDPYPHYYTMALESGIMMVKFINSPKRIGPERQNFAYEYPYDKTYWSAEGMMATWDETMNQKYDFFGVEFFKNEIDKLSFVSGGKING